MNDSSTTTSIPNQESIATDIRAGLDTVGKSNLSESDYQESDFKEDASTSGDDEGCGCCESHCCGRG